MPGPVPKRTETRRRRNKPEGAELVKAPSGARVTWPKPDRDWHDGAKAWFLSLEQSGQATFYEQSDVALAAFVATMMSSCLSADRPSAQMVTAVLSAQADLLTTEAARRRARIELERNTELAAVTPIKNYRSKAE